MTTINWRRVAVGGVAAGVVMNAMDALTNGVLLFDDYRANSARLGLSIDAMRSASSIVTIVALDFVYGVVLVWLYAAMLPRFGRSIGTAVRAALAFYLATMGIVVGFALMGVLTRELFAYSAVAGLVTTLAGAILGSRFYKEKT